MRSIIACILFVLLSTSGFAAESPSANKAGKEDQPKQTTYESLDSLFSLYQPYLSNIGAYKPIYFLVGVNPKDSRFQISLQYQLFSEECPLALCEPWLAGIHLGYTQTSSWDLKSNSAPFEDTSYKPEVFFLTKNVSLRPRWTKGLFYQFGLKHESNGQADEKSRSTNMFYVKPIGIIYSEASGLGIQISPQFTAFFNNSDSTNPHIADYRGRFGLELKTGWARGAVLDSVFRFAKKGISTQLDLTYPISLSFFSNLSLYLHVQYADALAETLLNYRERNEALRIGIALVR